MWGVTLHEINYGIDTGDIWVQKKIKIDLMKDNSDMYQIAKDELYKLFKKNYSKIFNKKIRKIKQIKKYKFLKKKDVRKYDSLNLTKKLSVKNFIKLFLSRSFGDTSYIN